MPKRLKWSQRAIHDAKRIADYYTETASHSVAIMANQEIVGATIKLITLPAVHRAGKANTREYVMTRFPFTIIYRSTAHEVRIVRVLH